MFSVQKLQLVQNGAVRFLTRSGYRERIIPVFCNCIGSLGAKSQMDWGSGTPKEGLPPPLSTCPQMVEEYFIIWSGTDESPGNASSPVWDLAFGTTSSQWLFLGNTVRPSYLNLSSFSGRCLITFPVLTRHLYCTHRERLWKTDCTIWKCGT